MKSSKDQYYISSAFTGTNWQHMSRTVLLTVVLLFIPLHAISGEMATIRLAYGKKIQYAPQIIAVEQNFFKAEGLHIQPLILSTGPQAAEALITGAADAAAMGDAPAVFAAASGRPLKIIAAYGTSEDMHRIVASANSGIHSPSDLKGKRVAIQFGTSTYGAFLLFCQKHAIEKDDIGLINLSPTDMPIAMQSGQIDAAVGSEPWPSNIEEKVVGSYPVISLSGLGNEYPHVMVVSEKLSIQNPEAVVAMMRALQQAIDMINLQPHQAAEIVAGVTGVPAHREMKSLQTIHWKLRLDEAIRNSLMQTADMFKQQNKLPLSADIKRALDGIFLKNIQSTTP
ncbi:MAG: NrtA/SsuA/CpmA family ABC transporter substrate-binding protein [Desulfatirhabdiaceae bacterium]